MGFILFCILPSTFMPRGGSIFLTTGSLHTTTNCLATLALSQANIFSIVKGKYQSNFKIFGRQAFMMADSWTEIHPTR